MINFFKAALTAILYYRTDVPIQPLTSSNAPTLPSPVCDIAKESILYGDLARWNERFYSCRSINLDPERCNLGTSYIQTRTITSLPRATTGSVPVYLGDGIVIKKFSQQWENDMRRKKDQAASKIIQKKGYNRLTVPASCIDGYYSINERLPIESSSTSAKLYYKHPDYFTLAVEQFTHLTLQIPLRDIIGTISDAGKPRFDNVVPYLTVENGQRVGKLGLIDLEHLDTTSSCDDDDEIPPEVLKHYSESVLAEFKRFRLEEEDNNWEMARDLLLFFPCHHENIMGIIRQYHPKWLEEHKDDFQKAIDISLDRLRIYSE